MNRSYVDNDNNIDELNVLIENTKIELEQQIKDINENIKLITETVAKTNRNQTVIAKNIEEIMDFIVIIFSSIQSEKRLKNHFKHLTLPEHNPLES
jgi:sugar-specific transcriptional regulator TrmB